MDLSKILRGFVKIVICICKSYSMYFGPFAKQAKLIFDQDAKLVEISALNKK